MSFLPAERFSRGGAAVVAACWFLAAAVVAVLHLREPWLGDDLDYWSFAVHFHEPRFGSELDDGFHALRWPVWGVIWLFQHVLPKGLPSYYAEPMFYFALGALAMRLWAARVFGVGNPLVAVAMLVYLYHPLLADVAHRPMPDLSEGVWMAFAMLAWWSAMRAKRVVSALPAVVLGGLFLQLCFANRFTGLIIVPVMALCTLALAPRRWWRMGLMVAAFVFFFALEGLVYQALHGSFWHAIEANASGRGRPGTEPVPLWWFPFRFLPALWEGDVLKVIFMVAALAGAAVLWRRDEARKTSAVHTVHSGRLCVLWAVLLYLGYSCAIQSVDPPRPLIRDGDRFVASLAWPLGLLTAAGLWAAWRLVRMRPRLARWLGRHRKVAVGLVLVVLVFSNGRKFGYGFSRELGERIAATPPGTRIATHSGMRDLVALTDFEQARRFVWEDVDGWYQQAVCWEEIFARNDELWMQHKEAWLKRRKQLEQEPENTEFVPVFFASQEMPVLPRQVIAVDARADLYFFDLRELRPRGPRTAGDGATAPVRLRSVFLRQDFMVDFKKGREEEFEFELAAPGRVGVLGIFYEADCNKVRPFEVEVEFLCAGRVFEIRELLMYFNPAPGRDAVFCDVPAGAEKARLVLRCRQSSGRANFERLEIFVR
jgi:hypothetical protein